LIFARLAAKPDSLVTRDEILSVMRGKADHTVDSHIMAIRRKLAERRQGVTIQTVTGKGFILRLPAGPN
jgi:DNA-binding response OmpR family regulator